MSVRRTSLLAAGVVGCLLLSVQARATPKSPEEQLRIAREHLGWAKAAFARHDYEKAARQWELAYRFRQEPALLFNIGQAHRLAGNYQDAKLFYERYLAALPEPANKEETQRFLAEVARKAAEAPDQQKAETEKHRKKRRKRSKRQESRERERGRDPARACFLA